MVIKNTTTNSVDEGMKLITRMIAKITFTNNNQKLHGIICKPTRSTNNYNRPRGEGEPSHSIRVRAPHQKP